MIDKMTDTLLEDIGSGSWCRRLPNDSITHWFNLSMLHSLNASPVRSFNGSMIQSLTLSMVQ